MNWFAHMTTLDLIWTGIGLAGQGLFSMRFIYQWLKSEQAKRSVVPEAFWYFSFAGGVTLLAYAIRQQDIVFMLGQGSGLLIYARNIWLIWSEKRRHAAEADGLIAP
jgi:lipid-A-disaccharide synthase-like uncharacterized protein